MADLKVNLCGVEFKNPVIAASGTFGFGKEFDALYDIGVLGGISTKGLTLEKRLGNAVPRIAEGRSVILNAVGLQNPGLDAFLAEDLDFLKSKNTVIIANVAGKTVEDYEEICARLDGKVDMIELNISCPNVKCGGLQYGVVPELAAEVTEAAKKSASVPVMVKLSPNVTDITAIAKAVEAAGADAVSLINTVRGMRIDVKTRRPVLKMNTGGLSGPAVLPIAVRMVWEVSNAVGIPVMGMGGISTGEDAAQMMLAGASAVAVGTANLVDPFAALRIRDELAEIAAAQNLSAVRELTGGVRPW